MTPQEFAEKALDVPFLEHGRDMDGWDCWGLVASFYHLVLGLELPSYNDEYGSTRRRKELAALMLRHRTEHWVLSETPALGDVALLMYLGYPCHVGVMLDKAKVLHVLEKEGTLIEDVGMAPWRGAGYDNVEGIYRRVDGPRPV